MQKIADKIQELIGLIQDIHAQGKEIPVDLLEDIDSLCSDTEELINYVEDRRYAVQAVRTEGS